ncbi:transcription factor APG-like isoform X2 [Panicum virgatum]|uniref:BHLH domain-containing protein n=1 Tax=Panicum virgatum TaxID=38727 RepID=A0A8T0UPD1_PANVG|nr:transcription factor APG-like isoform X2 [Panicum virgatum]KAG2624510.1 hypothetical protein PVAP13_3KG139000 [Panicum virgatum]
MTGPGDELAELLWDNGPALRRAPPPFQPFTCSAAGSSRAHELKRHAAAGGMAPVPLGLHGAGGLPDEDAVPWLHCPVAVDVSDADTAPLPPEYCAGLLSEYSGLQPAPPAAVPASRAAPREAAAKQATLPGAASGAGEGVMNFTFFSRPLQRPQASAAAAASNPVESTVVQAATNRLRATPLFSEQRMAWLQPPKGPRAAAPGAAPAPAPQAPLPTEHRLHGEAATVTQCRLQPEARAPDAAAATAVVTTSSVCSGNGDRSQQPKRSSSHQVADCSVSPDEDLDDEGGAMRRSAARSNKRSRTAERRRDRINEKMRALQELIPNCNKIDKASMLEEAIEYLKTLQLQVQMMSMGTGLCVPPMLLPAMQVPVPHPMAHFPHLGMGLGFGMGAAAAAAFDMARAAGAHFPCPPMPMPPGPMFGVPGQAMPSPAAAAWAHMAGSGTTPAEHIEAAAAPPAREEAEPLPPPVPVVTQGDQIQKLQHPKQT